MSKMSKQPIRKQSAKRCHVGVDVSQDRLDVQARTDTGAPPHTAHFANTGAGHRQLITWLTKGGRSARVVLEATGVYSLDLALALDAAERIEVMVVNPRAARKFAEACLQRSSTDATMAAVLQEYAARMEFVAWTPPPAPVRAVRAIARRLAARTLEKTRELNRHHAAGASADTPAVVANDVAVNVRHLQRRIAELERHALTLITTDPALQSAYQHLLSVCGIADTTAIQLLGELLVLPADMTARQWVAHSGLDVRHVDSGSSVHKAPRISKQGNAHLRRILYMPALVAVQREAHVRAFYDQLLAAGKQPLQALVAVMRKLLHAIWGMLKTDTDFDGSKFRKLPQAA
jgi:transposase